MRRATTPCRIRSMMRTIPLLSSGFDLLNGKLLLCFLHQLRLSKIIRYDFILRIRYDIR
ncbi:hypothetical protein KSS87_017101, partial [Heliosperma pusillum]